MMRQSPPLGSDPVAEQRVRAGEFQAQRRMREPNNWRRASPRGSYWIWRPEMALEMIKRWISDVPSKIV
jgi:hypothetical protein